MDFPKETIDLADRTAAQLREQHGEDPLLLAQGLYTHLHGRFSYGFLEGMVQGYFIRYPHEIQKQWECIEAAAYTYVVARSLGLDPRMRTVKRWFMNDTGHETVDVAVRGERWLVDPLNAMIGKVTYDNELIRVDDNQLTDCCEMPCQTTAYVDEQTILARMEFYRSDAGIMRLLEAGQSFSIDSTTSSFIHLNRRHRTLKYRIQFAVPFMEQQYMEETYRYGTDGLRTLCAEDGVCSTFDWAHIKQREPFVRTTYDCASGAQKTYHFRSKKNGHAEANILRTLLINTLRMNDGREFVYDERELPLDLLRERIDNLEPTPQNKHARNQLRRSVGLLENLRVDNPLRAERLLDKLTLVIITAREAKERGITIGERYNQRLRDEGFTDVATQTIAQGRSYFGGGSGEDPGIQFSIGTDGSIDRLFRADGTVRDFPKMMESGLLDPTMKRLIASGAFE